MGFNLAFTGLNILNATKRKAKVPNACHEIVWGVQVSLNSFLSSAQDGGDWSTSCLSCLFPEKVPTLSIEWRLCESWSRSGYIREEKHLLFLHGIELQFLGCPAHSHITILTRPWSMDTNVLVLNYVPCQSHFTSVNF